MVGRQYCKEGEGERERERDGGVYNYLICIGK